MISQDDRRIARNTLFLYGRMLLTVVVSLYTSRVVLETLGVDNYGIYNLVGGIVTIFAFLNGTMSGATQRFINFEIGNSANDLRAVKKVFSTSMAIHISIAIILFVAAETVGLWFVNTQLVIAPERMVAANWVYQFSILATIVTVLQIPFTASIMAYERMDAYAYISLGYTFMKLGIVLLLLWVATFDTLICYAALYFAITLATGLLFMIYCYRHFEPCRGRLTPNGSTAREMIKFCGWDVFGNMSHTARVQGSNIILNRFGGAALNAAGGLALTVSTTMYNFATTVIMSFRPQIMQQYARGNFQQMFKLMNNAAKFSQLLMLVFVIPIFIEMPYVLSVWLKEVPEYTVVFCRLCVITTLGDVLKSVIDAGIHATGRVFRLSFITGLMLLAELPVMWWLIWATHEPAVVYGIHAAWIFVIVLVECFILKYQMRPFSVVGFCLKGAVKPLLIAVPAVVAAVAVWSVLPDNFWRLLLVTLASLAVLTLLTYTTAIDPEIRRNINQRILKTLKIRK